jgi:RHS repeat-associated protein
MARCSRSRPCTCSGANRILSFTETGSQANQTYSYDAFGNRTVSGWMPYAGQTPTTGSAFPNNQWAAGSGVTYDGAGNQLSVSLGAGGTRLFTYDAENRQKTASIPGMSAISYVYDGEGRRVQKTVGTTGTTFVYDAAGRLAAEYGGPTNPLSGTTYLTDDHLGSRRLVTNAGGAPVNRYDYAPFGEELTQGIDGRTSTLLYPNTSTNAYPTVTPDGTSQKFTSKERDAETGLDYFGARYMSSAQGRFTSPDVPLLDQREDDPQSWNLYSYGRNNPLRYTDPTGNCTVDGEQHFGSCIWHTLGFYQTKKEQAAAAQKEADEDRTAMAQWHGFSINGQTPADIAKNGTNQQVIGAYKSGMGFLTGVAMQSLAPCPAGVACGVIPIGPAGELGAAAEEGGIVAQNGTRVAGFTSHGIDRVIGDTAERAGTRPEAILDALKNPKKIVSGVDQQGRPFEIFTGKDARVVVNPQSGKVVSVNPMSGAGASK